MQVRELDRRIKRTGEIVVDIEIDKLRVRLISTYDKEKSFDEILYILACRRLAERIA